jgi:hypothetical protein
LDRRSRARFEPAVHGALVRLAVGRATGYLPGHSKTVRVQ